MATEARISKRTGISEHRHPGNLKWHWACAGHRDRGETHEAVDASNPEWETQPTLEERQLYGKALARDILHRIIPGTWTDFTVSYKNPEDRKWIIRNFPATADRHNKQWQDE